MSYLQLRLGWALQSCYTIAVMGLVLWEEQDVATCIGMGGQR